jgi:hypothetical protein
MVGFVCSRHRHVGDLEGFFQLGPDPSLSPFPI